MFGFVHLYSGQEVGSPLEVSLQCLTHVCKIEMRLGFTLVVLQKAMHTLPPAKARTSVAQHEGVTSVPKKGHLGSRECRCLKYAEVAAQISIFDRAPLAPRCSV